MRNARAADRAPLPEGHQLPRREGRAHKLAEIEPATPASERWCVNTEDFNESGGVYLELADATPVEAARGKALLKWAATRLSVSP